MPKVGAMLDTTSSSGSIHGTSPHALGSDRIPFVAANAWIKAAAHCRFNIDPLFAEAGIDLSASNVVLIRSSALANLMVKCVNRAAPDFHFPLVLGELFAFDHLPALETFLATSPTLRQTLPALQWAGMIMPNLSLRVEERGRESALMLDVDAHGANPAIRGYFVEAIFAAISKIVRLALGSTAMVGHIDLRHQPRPLFMAMAAAQSLVIRTGRPTDEAVFSTQWLDMPLPGASPGLHQRAQALVHQQLPMEFNSTVELLEASFKHTPALLGHNLERMAGRLDLHPRTLQRRLREEGEQFTDIQARSRLDLAKKTLQS